MTRHMFSYGCDEVRKLAYQNRQSNLNKEDLNRFELHLKSCETCSDYVARTDGMLNAAQQIDYGKDIDPNTLFASIMSKVDSKEEEPLFSQVIADEDGVEETSSFSRPLRYALFGIVATLLVGLSLTLLPELIETSTPLSKQKEAKLKKEVSPQQSPPSRFADLVLQPSPSHAKNLNIFGDARAEWKVRGSRTQHLELKEGTVLIEYVPSHRSASLELQTTQFSIQVLGTIFYASKESQIVGVVAGKIRLQTADGQKIVLERGQEYVPGVGLRNTKQSVLLESERFVNVQLHNERLASIPSMVKAPKTREGSQKTRVAALKKRDLRKEANLAISKGDYKVAAQILERMVNELPPTAPENATLQLDLARIYIKQLKQPRRALGHLKGFTKQRPLDAATPSAKKEMCRISKRLNLHDREACQD